MGIGRCAVRGQIGGIMVLLWVNTHRRALAGEDGEGKGAIAGVGVHVLIDGGLNGRVGE